MADYITQCGHCGCREFCVTETIDWDGEVDDDGILSCRNSSTQSVAFTVPNAARPTQQRALRILNSINSAKRNARRS
jgi:hypothetical protein